jgi:hypothetical protein
MAAPYRLRAARPVVASPSGAFGEDVLGPQVRTYRAAPHGHVIWAAAPFVLLIAYGVWLAHQGLLLHWFNSTFSVFAVATLFVLSVMLIVYTAAVGGAETVRVHANGILDLRAGPRAIRWDEMQSLTAVWSAQLGRVEGHVLRTTDGATIAFNRTIGGVDTLVEELRLAMLEHTLPELEARLQEGGSVRFGTLVASADGITLADRALPWADVGGLEAEGGHVVVRTRAGERWAEIELAKVPNAFLLAEIAEHKDRS